MADDLDDKTLDKLAGIQSENASDDIIPAEEITPAEENITNPNQETGKMEVHHHPHVGKKNFKEYVLEGLMIFLAVTLGFFAENIREHFVNNEKETQYIKSFYTDLSTDETQLSVLLASIEEQQVKAVDSLSLLLNTASVNTPANGIYFFIRKIIRQQGIKAFVTDKTVEQVKNAGEFRLIHNQQIADSLSDYYKKVEYTSYLQQILVVYKNKLKDDFPLILKGTDYNKTIENDDNNNSVSETLHLLSADPIALNKIQLSISEIKGLSISIKRGIRLIRNEAGNIKKLIAEHYNLG